MSLEQSIQDLKASIENLIGSIQTMGTGDMESPVTPDPGSPDGPGNAGNPDGPGMAMDSEPAPVLATRKQYIFFKDNNSGAVLEKGDEVPTDNGATGVNKVTFEKLAKKHGFDPATGQPEVENDSVEDDDLADDDLDEVESQSEPEVGGDDDEFDFGDDDEEAEEQLTDKDVKAALMKFIEAKQGDRELGLKVLKKFGAASVSALPKEKYAEVIDFCTRGAEKAKSKKA